MCGICGIVAMNAARNPAEAEVQAMARVLHHRGPDDYGFLVEGPVALGFRRLSIIDLATGHQPMTNEDGTLEIIFNGEIYNHADLRRELEARGHRYRTRSDTETILHLYEEERENCVSKLRGMFAFAIWDRGQKKLFCARDRLGIKPFYYTVSQGRLLFASEIKALLELPEVRRQVNRFALAEFFSLGYVSGPETLFDGIGKLTPGHWMTCQDGRITVQPYWNLRFSTPANARPLEEYVEEFRQLFTESVRLRLMSDVPLGAFLSGGLDSTAVVAIMSELTGRRRIQTFSVGYVEGKYDEMAYARQVAQHFETEHHEVLLGRQEFFASLPKLIWHEDEPLVWPSSVSLYFVSRLAAKHVKVILTGEGSDELLAGYSRYWATLWNLRLGGPYWKLAPRGVQKSVRRLLDDSVLPAGIARKLRHSFFYWSPNLEDIYLNNFLSNFTPEELPGLLGGNNGSSAVTPDPYRTALAYSSEAAGPDQLAQLQYTDMRTYLVELLMKQDNMSMATSVESRVPFLDHKLVEAVCAMPSWAKLHGFTTKYVLRKAMENIVPPMILKRPKRGFPTPLPVWMREQHSAVRSILSNRRLGQREIVRPEAVRSLLDLHESGKRDCTYQLWRLLNFELWCRIFFDRDGSECESDQTIGATV